MKGDLKAAVPESNPVTQLSKLILNNKCRISWKDLIVILNNFGTIYFYVVFFEKLKSKTDYFGRNMNSIIGIITGIVAIITLVNVLNYYY